MKYLLDPRLFNFIILFLYALNIARWAYEGRSGNMMYWIGAFWITASVTFLEQSH